MPLTISDEDLFALSACVEIDEDVGLIQADLASFTRYFWDVLEPTTPYREGWHLQAINEHLEAVAAGQIRNLLVNIPPRHCKSLAVSVFFPMWLWVTRPETRFLYSSYALSLSIRDSRKCRQIIESPKFQSAFGHVFHVNEENEVTRAELKLPFTLERDQNQKIRFENDRMGYRIATSVGGTATGEGGDYVVVDDPHSVQDKESEVVRESTLTWWDEVMSTRLNDPKTGAKIIVMQRVHEADLSGHVLKQGGYEHLCLPAEFEPSRKCFTSLGWSDPRTTEGELLWPERVGPAEIADFKIRLGPIGYAGQFQQGPAPAGGSRFKSEYFRYWLDDANFYRLIGGGHEKVVIKSDCYRFSVLDPAGIDGQQNDKACYSVLYTFDVTPDADMILIDEYRAQVETPQLANDAADICRRFATSYLAVEQNGLGLGVVQTIGQTGVAVIGINATKNKEARSETAEIRMAAGKVYFPQGAPYLFDLEQELVRFPNAEYCDRVDALSWGCIMVQQRHGAPSVPQSEQCDTSLSGRYRRNF
jgi:predicted phage terminase large subunit-like protein